MPIKEIITMGIIAVASIAVTHGPGRLKSGLRKVEFQILKEVGRTDNWGNPDIFVHGQTLNRSR